MALTLQHGLLARLLDYVVEQSREIDPKAFTLAGASDFRRFPKDLAALPGVDLDVKEQGDHVWLRVRRLEAQPAPQVTDAAVRPFVSAAEDPGSSVPAPNDIALKHQHQADVRSLGEIEAGVADDARRLLVVKAVERLLPLWSAWAEGEKPRRQAISLYGDLFMLMGRLEAEEAVRPSELVWGIGVSAWRFDGELIEGGSGKAVTVDYQYPLLTQVVEIEIDSQTHTLSVRPRAVSPRLEFDAFGVCQVMGAADVEKQAKLLLSGEAEHPITPFDVASFEPILKLVAGTLSRTGVYDAAATDELPSPKKDLRVTPGWVLLVRERSSNYLVEDIRRLKDRLLAGDVIPEGPRSLVTPPVDEVVRYESIAFRGLCGAGRGKGEPRELFFPLPYNQEQEAIIEMLERAPGVSVQGPPGTGKTHTIANIVCHYLATGRKVLVTSKGEHALEVLQSKIPEDVRPLTVALLSGDKEGMRQFQASIEAIVHRLSQLNSNETVEEIVRCRREIEAAHEEIARLDRRVDEIARQQLASIDVDGVQMRAQKMAELVLEGRELHGWFDDEVTLAAEHAPPMAAADMLVLREARRRLGTDLVYVTARLPSSFSLLPTEALGRVHAALVGMQQIDAAAAAGQLRELRALTPEALGEARRMLTVVEHVTKIVRDLEDQGASWVFELRSKCRRPEFLSEVQALVALFGEIDELVKARAAFLQRPVELPSEALGSPRFLQAVGRAKESGKPFGLFALGAGEAKDHVGSVRIAGLAPASGEDWQHVDRYVRLHARVHSFSVRWNQFAESLSVPQVKGSVEALRSVELTALLARKAHDLATLHDANLPSLAAKVFRVPPSDELRSGSAHLAQVAEQLRQHLTRSELASAAAQLAILQEKLAGKSGPVTERLRDFIARSLGNQTIATERAVAGYAELISELKRIESRSQDLVAIEDLCRRIERSGGVKWANRLRTIPVGAAGEDDVVPVTWREAWNWARVRSHLDQIEAREELLDLAVRRRDLERVLAMQYERMVSKSAWLKTKEQASAKVLSALETYRTAIRKIGQGTGTNATRNRRDAQVAMMDAQGAVPCWIMSHSKVSESMPARLGVFDLVIVDEASQSNLWALPAILRGTKILVVGDDKQVSPDGGFTSAAKIQALRARFLGDQAYEAVLTPDRSLYDIASTVFAANRVMLAEHFRCVVPIISYSNRVFYKNQIRPLRLPRASERIDPPLVDVYVSNGYRTAKDINTQEVDFIAAEILAILSNPRLAKCTIGVVSLLGPEQARAVDLEVRRRCDAPELIRRKFECGDARVFQGSERNIMFLSMVADSANHHALSGNMFDQRFNVAASRARDRMYLVRSVRMDELSPVDIRRTLLEHFSKPAAPIEDATARLIELCESGFERDVYTALYDLGYRVTPQVKAGAYFIDLVVEGADDARLAIECDGDEFHGPDRWDADMRRQRVLERAGWVFWRCFASTWSLRKDAVVTELRIRLHAMGIEPLGAIERLPSLVEFRPWPYPAAPPSGVESWVMEASRTASVPQDTIPPRGRVRG